MADDNSIIPQNQPLTPRREDDEAIELVEPEGPTRHDQELGGVKTFGAHAAPRGFGLDQARKFKRPLNVNGAGATRCRLFHSKIALASLQNMESQVNDWLDGEKIEVKQVGHLIGTMEGKRPEPNLLVMVWY
jgi:hypothetical protein